MPLKLPNVIVQDFSTNSVPVSIHYCYIISTIDIDWLCWTQYFPEYLRYSSTRVLSMIEFYVDEDVATRIRMQRPRAGPQMLRAGPWFGFEK